MTTWAAGAAASGGVGSLLITGFWVAAGPREEPSGPALALWLLEIALLLVLIFLSVRKGRPRSAAVAASLCALAVGVSLLRFGSLSPQLAGGCCAWGLSAVVAALIGGYLRLLDLGRQRAVEQARLQQRLELASDLHDYVAHDVSEILAQVQAAQILARTDPGRLPRMLERMDAAAVRALDTLDRTVHGALQENPSTDGPEPGLWGSVNDIAPLANRFQSSGTVQVDVQVQDEAVGVLSQEAGREVYRAVVEALTNIRRHATEARKVRIAVRRGPEAGQVELSVTDDAPAVAEPDPARTGHGLASLSARIQGLGGTVWAGPGQVCGWRLLVTLPVTTETAREERSMVTSRRARS